MTYAEQLKHPKWVELSKRIKSNDLVCKMCGGEDRLEVHHAYYERGLLAWEYPIETLHTLCNICHKRAEMYRLIILRQLASIHPQKLEDLGCGLDIYRYTKATTDFREMYLREISWEREMERIEEEGEL